MIKEKRNALFYLCILFCVYTYIYYDHINLSIHVYLFVGTFIWFYANRIMKKAKYVLYIILYVHMYISTYVCKTPLRKYILLLDLGMLLRTTLKIELDCLI